LSRPIIDPIFDVVGSASLQHFTYSGEPLYLELQNLVCKETRNIAMNVFWQTHEPFSRRSRVWQTDGRTDKHSGSKCCALLRCRAKNFIYWQRSPRIY